MRMVVGEGLEALALCYQETHGPRPRRIFTVRCGTIHQRQPAEQNALNHSSGAPQLRAEVGVAQRPPPPPPPLPNQAKALRPSALATLLDPLKSQVPSPCQAPRGARGRRPWVWGGIINGVLRFVDVEDVDSGA